MPRIEDPLYHRLLSTFSGIISSGLPEKALENVVSTSYENYLRHYGKEFLVAMMDIRPINQQGAAEAFEVFAKRIFELKPEALMSAYLDFYRTPGVPDSNTVKPDSIVNNVLRMSGNGGFRFKVGNISGDIFLLCVKPEDIKRNKNSLEAFKRLYRITNDSSLLQYLDLNTRGVALDNGLGL